MLVSVSSLLLYKLAVRLQYTVAAATGRTGAGKNAALNYLDANDSLSRRPAIRGYLGKFYLRTMRTNIKQLLVV